MYIYFLFRSVFNDLLLLCLLTVKLSVSVVPANNVFSSILCILLLSKPSYDAYLLTWVPTKNLFLNDISLSDNTATVLSVGVEVSSAVLEKIGGEIDEDCLYLLLRLHESFLSIMVIGSKIKDLDGEKWSGSLSDLMWFISD